MLQSKQTVSTDAHFAFTSMDGGPRGYVRDVSFDISVTAGQ